MHTSSGDTYIDDEILRNTKPGIWGHCHCAYLVFQLPNMKLKFVL